MRKLLQPLLDFLAVQRPTEISQWRYWQIRPVRGGANSLVYRVLSAEHDLAVKLMVRDSRCRGQREFSALRALRSAGLTLGPAPILLDETTHAQTLLVQSWLEGEVTETPPATDAEWIQLIEQHALFHGVAADKGDLPLRAVISPNSVAGCQEAIQAQLRHIPSAKQTPELGALVRRFFALPVQEWPTPRPMLCHDDANITNFVRRPGQWATVDWENSGWGDPAFDIADLMAHPAYATVQPSQWPWVVQSYCDMIGQSHTEQRIWIYYKMMLVWWVVRLERALHEIPAGLDRRLVERPANWQSDLLAKRKHYLLLAVEAL